MPALLLVKPELLVVFSSCSSVFHFQVLLICRPKWGGFLVLKSQYLFDIPDKTAKII